MSPFEEYRALVSSGMFWERYPQLTGNWDRDRDEWMRIIWSRQNTKLIPERSTTKQQPLPVKYVPKIGKMTSDQFTSRFKTERMDGLWYCFGTCNGISFSHEAKCEEDARIEMWQVLASIGFIEAAVDYKPGSRITLLSTSIPEKKK